MIKDHHGLACAPKLAAVGGAPGKPRCLSRSLPLCRHARVRRVDGHSHSRRPNLPVRGVAAIRARARDFVREPGRWRMPLTEMTSSPTSV